MRKRCRARRKIIIRSKNARQHFSFCRVFIISIKRQGRIVSCKFGNEVFNIAEVPSRGEKNWFEETSNSGMIKDRLSETIMTWFFNFSAS